MNLIKTAELIPLEISETEDTAYVIEPELTTLRTDMQVKHERKEFRSKIACKVR